MNSTKGEQEAYDEILLKPLNYITPISGIHILTKLVMAFDHWLNIDPQKLLLISEVVQSLQSAGCLIDDIEDNSKLRQGISAAHNIYGVANTINSANYAYFLGLEKILLLDNVAAVKVFTEQLLELHRGQGKEIYWRDSVVCPTEDDYKQMAFQKTGGLFGLTIRLMQLFSKNNSDFIHLIDILALYFQIIDDYSNLCSKKHMENESYCADITEGKFSFPIIYAIRENPEDDRILNVLRQRTTDLELKKYCFGLLEKCGSLVYTRKIMCDLDKRAIKEILKLGGNPLLLAILDEFRTYERLP